MTRSFLITLLVFAALAPLLVAVDQSWKKHISQPDRAKTNPFAGDANAIAAGSRLFADHCSKCHGADALGRGKRPSLRTPEVQSATEGEIFWILRNGVLRRGMPSWSSLPEASRWQLVTYVKSLGVTSQSQSSEDKGHQE